MYNKGINKGVSILVVASLLRITSSVTYYVTPDNSSQAANNVFTLQHYIDNAKEFFKPHHQLHFLSGQYYLQDNFILQNVSNFTMNGNKSILICKSKSLGIMISNVESLMITNIEFKQCSKVYNVKVDRINNMSLPWRGALYINYSSDIIVYNVSVTISAGTSGIIVINSKGKFNIANFRALAICEEFNLATSGILVYNDDYNNSASINYEATNISYKTNGLCNNSFSLVVLMTQEQYGITFSVYNTSFSHLYNSSIMYYHGESCGVGKTNVVAFENCKMDYNCGNPNVNMFYISIYGAKYMFLDRKLCDKQNIINFTNCGFTYNSNMNSLLFVDLKNSLTSNTIINIVDSYIIYNKNISFIVSRGRLKVFSQLSLNINIKSINISGNTHSGLASLISLKNTVMKFMDKVIINNNQYRVAIIELYFSVINFVNYAEFSNNHARHILYGKDESFYLLEEGSTINITKNIVYIAIHNTLSFDDNLEEICWFQFASKQGNLDKHIEICNYSILMITNKYIAPIHQLSLKSRNCSWLTGTAFQTSPSRIVYQKVFKTKKTKGAQSPSTKDMMTIQSRLCHCVNTSYDCSKRELGQIFPGQTLKAHLMMDPSIPSKCDDITIKIESDNVPPKHACITDVLERIQTGRSHSCIQYNYTIWYAGQNTKCELYLSTENMPEIFFVKIKPCPIGFSLHSAKRTCDCDTTLNMLHNLLIPLCNLDDETILRPANSWLSADSIDDSHTYRVAPSCPFDYCLPYSSYLSFSNPDAQCQFSRSGDLCGKCKKGLSSVFASSRCKKCSSKFLFIIIPIAITGFIMVAILFIFNLTVTNGKINTIIFYANIININHLVFFPKHNSLLYIFLSLLNLDLGVEMCFYDGMDDYVKIWLQLLFPIYLLIMAGLLIMTSRYSTRIQRITARKVLPVLATLFLLSYNKIIRTISSVLCYHKIIELPSKKTTLVWSVCTNIPLFGAKFIILFTVCLILLLIVLPFNAILLFSRKLTYFKFINRLKPFLDAYHGPYKDKVPYWVGLQLVIRKIVLVLSGFNEDVNFLSVTILFGVLFCIHGIVNPFNSKFLNAQEALILLNLLAIHITAFYHGKAGNDSLKIIKYLILTAAIYFVIVLLYQCFIMVTNKANRIFSKDISNFKKSLKTKMLKFFKRKSSNNQGNKAPLELRTIVPDLSYNYTDFQEPLLALSD